MKKKAIGLLSGGLDSTLAVKLMIDQGIEVLAVNFISPFCNCTSKHSSCKNEAQRVCKEFGISFKAGVMGEDFLETVVNPKYGYGRNMNPCLDCRILMFKKAKQVMLDEGASFIFTGEVLGQRPMSQRRDSMRVVERDSGLTGLILRPLSARMFEETIPEKEGLVDREKLLAISGRSRKEQISLAEELHITDYPCPAGGCLLTDTEFSGKLKDVLAETGTLKMDDIHILKFGRHFRLNSGVKIVVGRNEHENKKIVQYALPNDILLEVLEFGSPTVLVRGKTDVNVIDIVSQIAVWYSSAPKNQKVEVQYRRKKEADYASVFTKAIDEKSLHKLRI